LVQFLFLIPLNNPQKAYGMDGVVKIIPRRSSLTGIIEEFGFNSICNQTLNKSANPPGDRGKAGSRVSLERGGKPTRAVLTASNILDHDAGH
jgi:hypothetical protein